MRRIPAQFVQQLRQRRIGGHVDLLPQSRQQVRAPLREIGGARRKALGMQREPQHVDRRPQQRCIDSRKQRRNRLVGRNQGPVPIDRERRIGLVTGEHQFDRAARCFQRGIGERPLRKHRRETGRHQHCVAFAQRHLELFRQPQHHLTRRLRTPGFEETQVPGGDLCVSGEIKLGQAAALPPLAQVSADGLHGAHGSKHRQRPAPAP
jgi:hypothetical protein